MFGKQNKTQDVNTSTLDDVVIDPKNIRTFIPAPSEYNKTVPSATPKKQESRVFQKDFAQYDLSQGQDLSIPEKVEIPENSPFFGSEENVQVVSSGEPTTKSAIGLETGSFLEERPVFVEQNQNVDQIKPSIKESIQGTEGNLQNGVVRPIDGMGIALESELSKSLPVENYSGMSGSDVIEKKAVRGGSPGRGFQVFFIILVFILIGLIAWGGYYYWKSRSVSPVTSEQLPIIVDNNPVTPQDNEVPFKYDWKIANTIIIDDQSGKSALSEVEKAMNDFSTYKGDGVLEFYFVDNLDNLTTVSSKALVDKLGITLPESVKALLKETGEGRVYLDKKGMDIRVVVALETTSRDSTLAGLLSVEPEMINDFVSIYMGKVVSDTKRTVFNDQVYREYAVRYHNIDLNNNFSLDYTFRRDTLLISSSKESLRAVLDTLDGKVSMP